MASRLLTTAASAVRQPQYDSAVVLVNDLSAVTRLSLVDSLELAMPGQSMASQFIPFGLYIHPVMQVVKKFFYPRQKLLKILVWQTSDG